MPARTNDRWKQDDSSDLRKAVKNFNAKLRRIEKKNPTLAKLMPDRVTVSEIKSKVTNGIDLRREINSLTAFTKRGAEELISLNSNTTTRITKWQAEEVQKATRNFNDKITRLEKSNPDIVKFLPDRISKKDLLNLVQTRKDLQKEINSLRRFSMQGAEDIVIAPNTDNNIQLTKWQKEEIERRASEINAIRKERYEFIQDLEMHDRGIPLGYTRGELGMGTIDQNATKEIAPFPKKMNQWDVNKRLKAFQKENQEYYWDEKEKFLRDNVIKGLRANYGSSEHTEDIEAIITAIEGMDFKEFYSRFMSETGVMEIVSPPPGADVSEIVAQNVEALKSIWIPNYEPQGE